MNSEQKTNWILASALLCAGLSLCFLIFYNSEGVKNSGAEENAIAQVEEVKNEAKFREKKSLSWSKLKIQDGIVENSTVFVGPDSSLNLKLSDSSVVVLGPNSIVTLSRPDPGQNLNQNIAFEISVKKGRVQVKKKTNNDSPKETIKLNLADLGSVILKENDSVVATQNDEKSAVQVSEGAPSFEATTLEGIKEIKLPENLASNEVANIEFEKEKLPEIKIEKMSAQKLPEPEMQTYDISDSISIDALKAMDEVQIKPEIKIAAKPVEAPPLELPEEISEPVEEVVQKAVATTEITQKKEKVSKKIIPPKEREISSVNDEPQEIEIPGGIKTVVEDQQIGSRHFKNFLQFEGASFGLVSNINAQNVPLAMWGSIFGRYWTGKSTFFEGRIGSKIMNYNSASNRVSPYLLGAQVHKSWDWPVSWVGFIKRFQVTALGGAEYYSNGQSGQTSENIFVTQYLMGEVGTSLRFDIFEKWDTGGYIILGYDISAKAQKYQIQGDINYHFLPLWNLGLGYRTRMYEAKTSAGSPNGLLPQREAYIEIFGSLRYFFDK